MTTSGAPPAPAECMEPPEWYPARIEVHLVRLTQGHDPLGHLFAIERLARAERAERMAVLHESSEERGRR